MHFPKKLACLPVIVATTLGMGPAPPAFGQSSSVGTGIQSLYISGFVRDEESHEFLRAVTVALRRGGGGDNAAPSVVSGISGEFQFNNVLSGDYRLEVNQQGYQPASMPIMLGGTALTNITVSLRPEHASRAFEDLAVSTHQLTAPDKAREAFIKGVKLLTAAKPDYQRALVLLEKAVAEFPTYYEAYAEMGIAYYHLGQPADAEQALRKSMSLSSNQYPDAVFLLAEMLDDQGRFAEAEPIARDGVRLTETSWRSHLALARALAGLKRAPEAEINATRASELKPDNPEIFLVLGNIHIQQHNYPSVIKDFDTFLKLEPTGPRSELVRQSKEQAQRAIQKMQARTSPSSPHP